MKRKIAALIFALLITLPLIAGCGDNGNNSAVTSAPDVTTAEPADPVTITIAGAWPDCRAIDEAASTFNAIYPNCTVEYEYLQDYYPSLIKRMSGENAVDLFFVGNIQADDDDDSSQLVDYALDVNSREDLDLTQTFAGLIENFTFRDDPTKLYSIPVGAEMRGLYVNKTLLDSLDIALPTDQASLLAACQTLVDNGYIPFHGNPGSFSQTLLYPWFCNIVANADDPAAMYETVNNRTGSFSEIFREPYEFLYTLIERGYYDYKRAQTELNLYVDSSDEAYAYNFLNIVQKDDQWTKIDDTGVVAFMPSPLSLLSTVEKAKDDYHSGIEYIFMPAPVGPDGGFAYLSPARGIAANKASEDVDWAVKFLDFLFTPENNKAFAESFNVIPNTKEAFSYIGTLYNIPDDHICHLGQVTFSYPFYTVIKDSITEVSKSNNPKYMQTAEDGSVSLYPLDYYLTKLEESVNAQ